MLLPNSFVAKNNKSNEDGKDCQSNFSVERSRKFSQTVKGSLCELTEGSTLDFFTPESGKLSNQEINFSGQILEPEIQGFRSNFQSGKISHSLFTEEENVQQDFEVFFN